METITWIDREKSGMDGLMPHRYATTADGRRVAFVRELATLDGYRISLFPDGNQNHAVEGRIYFAGPRPQTENDAPIPERDAFAMKMATRWLERNL